MLQDGIRQFTLALRERALSRPRTRCVENDDLDKSQGVDGNGDARHPSP
jgi:hypothetical protein